MCWIKIPNHVRFHFTELSGRNFGTILKFDALTFQSVSMQSSPVRHCSGRIEETLFQVGQHQGPVFWRKKAAGRAAPHRISEC